MAAVLRLDSGPDSAAEADAPLPQPSATLHPPRSVQPGLAGSFTASRPGGAAAAAAQLGGALALLGGGAAAPAPAIAPAPDAMQLYAQLMAAAAAPDAAEAGLTPKLVGRYLAAAAQPAQALAAAGAAASAEVAAAIRAQQEQQARLLSAMVAEDQLVAGVALMRSVVQLAGLAD
jgi:hypothetical protein